MNRTTYYNQVLSEYFDELTSGFNVKESDGVCLITTPFVLPDGHLVEVEASTLSDGTIRLSDSGDTIGFLWLTGLSLSSSTRKDIARIARHHKVTVSQDRLEVDLNDGRSHLHGLIQAILGVAGLIEKRRPKTWQSFGQEVEVAIASWGRNYDKSFQVPGLSKKHEIRFHIDGPVRILAQPMSHANEPAALKTAERYHRRFDDILKLDDGWKCFSIIDDRGKRKEAWTERAMAPLREVSTIVAWDEGREEFLRYLEKEQTERTTGPQLIDSPGTSH